MKQQRLCLAQDEYDHLNNALTTLGASRTSCESKIPQLTNLHINPLFRLYSFDQSLFISLHSSDFKLCNNAKMKAK